MKTCWDTSGLINAAISGTVLQHLTAGEHTTRNETGASSPVTTTLLKDSSDFELGGDLVQTFTGQERNGLIDGEPSALSEVERAMELTKSLWARNWPVVVLLLCSLRFVTTPVRADVIAGLPPPVPIGPGTTNEPGPELEAQTVYLKWRQFPGATSYRVFIRDLVTDVLNQYDVLPSSTNLMLGLTLGRKYRWNMVAMISTNRTEHSETLYFSIKLLPFYPRIREISPYPVPALDFIQVLTIHGYDFQPGCLVTLRLEDTGETFRDLPTTFRNYRSITINRNLTSSPGRWSIQVFNPGGFASERLEFPVVPLEQIRSWRWWRSGWPWTVVLVITCFVGGFLWWWTSSVERGAASLAREEGCRAEHARLSRTLHDRLNDLNQISLLSGKLNLMANTGKATTDQLQEGATKISSAVIEAVNVLEHLIWAGRPENDKLGNLIARVRQTFGRFREFNPTIHCELNFPPDIPERIVSPAFNEHLLCIVSEALRNVIKHAQAAEVRCQLTFDNDLMYLTIADNGLGFPAEDIRPLGHGISNIDRRSTELGGRLTVRSVPGYGTKITVELPLA